MLVWSNFDTDICGLSQDALDLGDVQLFIPFPHQFLEGESQRYLPQDLQYSQFRTAPLDLHHENLNFLLREYVMVIHKFGEMSPQSILIQPCIFCPDAEDDVDGEEDGPGEGLGLQPFVTSNDQIVQYIYYLYVNAGCQVVVVVASHVQRSLKLPSALPKEDLPPLQNGCQTLLQLHSNGDFPVKGLYCRKSTFRMQCSACEMSSLDRRRQLTRNTSSRQFLCEHSNLHPMASAAHASSLMCLLLVSLPSAREAEYSMQMVLQQAFLVTFMSAATSIIQSNTPISTCLVVTASTGPPRGGSGMIRRITFALCTLSPYLEGLPLGFRCIILCLLMNFRVGGQKQSDLQSRVSWVRSCLGRQREDSVSYYQILLILILLIDYRGPQFKKVFLEGLLVLLNILIRECQCLQWQIICLYDAWGQSN